MALKLKASSRETYKGYRIKKYGNEYSTVGCIWLFPTIDEVKIYIDKQEKYPVITHYNNEKYF